MRTRMVVVAAGSGAVPRIVSLKIWACAQFIAHIYSGCLQATGLELAPSTGAASGKLERYDRHGRFVVLDRGREMVKRNADSADHDNPSEVTIP